MYLNKYLLTFLLVIITNSFLKAQNYPIQSSLMLKGSASPFISDYVRLDDNPLMLTLVQSDVSFHGNVVFKFSLKGVGITIESQQTGSEVFSVSSGAPLILSGSDLSEYFLSSNLNFSGYSKAQYESKGVLPEGMYEFSFQAFNAERREVSVSNKATVLVWIQLHDPPQLVFPLTESIVEAKTPQQVSFQWQGTTIANANYILELYELKGTDNRNVNEIIRGAAPVFTTTTTNTTYNYTIKDPILIEGMKYAWRVKAEVATTSTSSSTNSNQLIKNEGYSSVFSFTYLPVCASVQIINRIPNKNGSAQINWMGEGKIYLIQYREKGQMDWYEELSTNQSIVITQLRPDHTYEYRVQSRCEYNKSNFTAIDTFSIPTSRNGINLTPPKDGYPQIELDKTTYLPQEEAAPGTLIYVNQFQMKIGMAFQDSKTQLYSGTGSIYVPMLKANVSVEFHNVQFNKARRLVVGLVYARQKEAPKTKIPPIKKVPQICITYGPDGFDQEGRDKEGYDRSGYNKEGKDKDGYDKFGYNAQNIDRNGKPKELPTDPLQIGSQAGSPTGNNNPNGTNTNNPNQTGNGPLSSNPQADGSDSTKTATVNPSVTQFAVDQNQIYGFDNSNSKAIWKSIEQGKEDKVIYNVKPSSVYPRIYFKSSDLSIFSVDPLKATSANQSLKLKSNGWADTTHLEIKLDSMKGKSIDKLNVVVYPKKIKNLEILILHEENDDVQVVAVGDKADQNTVCVTKGINDFLDTKFNWVNGVYNQQGDDTLNIDGNIIVGKNGICETEALNKPLKTATIDIAQLRDVLNNQIYNQAVLEWNVTEIKEITVNWDLNRNQKFEIYDYDSGFKLIPGAEFSVLKNYINENELFKKKDNEGIEIYYIILTDHSEAYISNNQFKDPYGFHMGGTNTSYAYVFGNKSPEKLRTIGHELGHSAFGFFDDTYQTKQPLNLMNHVDPANYLKRIFLLKEQWDIIQNIK